MKKTNLITHIINEDTESFVNDSMYLLSEADWTGMIFNPKKNNVLDMLAKKADERFNNWIDKRIEYIRANGPKKEYMNLENELKKQYKLRTKRATELLKANKKFDNDGQFQGIVDNIIKIKTEMLMLKNVLADEPEKAANKMQKMNDNDNKENSDKEQKLAHEIRFLESEEKVALEPVKSKFRKQIAQKYKELATLKGLGGVSSSGGTGG